MVDIKNPEDWWKVWQENRETLLHIFYRVNILPLENKEKKQESLKKLEEVEKTKDWQTLHLILQRAWDRLPDREWVHEIEGFYDLCNLCSEVWVFQEDEN